MNTALMFIFYVIASNPTMSVNNESQKALDLYPAAGDANYIWANIHLDNLNNLNSRTQTGYLQQPQNIKRNIPVPLPDHSGNIFLENETVIIPLPPELSESAVNWQVRDDANNLITAGNINKDRTRSSIIEIGKPGIGWYKIEFLDGNKKVLNYTTAAVIAKLAQPIPQDSPVCLDAAISWSAKNDPLLQKQLTNIAALAGVNWIRDRIRWREIQPDKDTFSENTQYHTAAKIQNKFGLKILQVFHNTPKWAVADDKERGRFPQDLRIVYDSCMQFGDKFRNWVQAWEPWNEANAANFGGHTMAEMCSYQKAAYLGFKAGNPDVIVCWNPYGGLSTEHHTNGILKNETWPYFDTYTIHSYNWPESYLRLHAPARKAACGKPLWLTECDRGMKSIGNEPFYDLSSENNLLKAQFMAQSYATSVYSGVERHFHFILGHYIEGSANKNKIQFGLLRKDLTPRPTYVALAALGRFLAGAKSLGRYTLPDQPHCHVYAFQAQPDGKNQDVLVAWAEIPGDWPSRGKYSTPWPLPNLQIDEIFDYLGRSLGNTAPPKLTSSPLFIILPVGKTAKLSLDKLPQYECPSGKASPIVLQISMPHSVKIIQDQKKPWIIEPQYIIKPGQETKFKFFAYNFSQKPAEGVITLEKFPKDWKISPARWEMHLEPMERKNFTATLNAPIETNNSNDSNWIKLQGDFSNATKTTLAFYTITNTDDVTP